jgi:hypothetical protein
MEQQTNTTAETTTQASWIIAGTVVFRLGWTWAGPSCERQSSPEPPVIGEQGELFGDDEELHAAPLPASGAQEDQAPLSAESDDDQAANENLRDPAVARFVDFRLPTPPPHDGRKGDVKIADAYDAISLYGTLERIYRALIRLCRERHVEKITEGVWRIELGYSDLAPAARCSIGSIRSGIRVLAVHGYILRYPEKWGGGHSCQYYVRDEDGMMAIFRAAGVRFARKKGKGDIALFRAVDEVKDDTIART